MERLKNLGLKRTFFLLSALCLTASLALAILVFQACDMAAYNIPRGGVAIQDGAIIPLEEPSPEQRCRMCFIESIQMLSLFLLPTGGLALAGVLFYRWKLKKPIELLRAGTERIRNQDLDFSIPAVSADELGQVCAAFETMRLELLKTNRELWRQAEERRRLNAAFAHDLRNPITVLKGTVTLLRQGVWDGQAIERLELYTQRIEQYVEAMSGIQRLEQLPVRRTAVDCARLLAELEETARLLAPALRVAVSGLDAGSVSVDHGLFLTAAENLLGNAARFAASALDIRLERQDGYLLLAVTDDGPGFPRELLESGPRPFSTLSEGDAHFGMGLYSVQLLCMKHGGRLLLENSGGAKATAIFEALSNS